ncbi:hypothetical protein FJZ53_01145 [Candidatus Woesearchaeota archaeon]|nr:hypothetical protein [Candidatus Woesearchaeota archaeon]
MRIPQIFINKKDLEDKVKQLFQSSKQPNPEGDVKSYADGEIEEFFRMYEDNPYDYLGNYCCLEKILCRVGYSKLEVKSKNHEYWTKKVENEESLILVVKSAYDEKHYTFARIKSYNAEKFCRKFELGRKLSYVDPLTITGAAVFSGASATFGTAYYLDTTLSKLVTNPLLDLLPAGLGIASMLFVSLGMIYFSEYLKDRYVTKWIKDNCTGFIKRNDLKALKAALA